MPKDRPPASKTVGEAGETRLLVKYAFDMAERLNVRHILVRADLLQDRRLIERHRQDQTVVWLVDREDLEENRREGGKRDVFVAVPSGRLDRMDLVTVGLTGAVLQKKVSVDDSVICLSGIAGSKRIDSMLIANPRRDFSWFRQHPVDSGVGRISSETGMRIMDIALRFAAEGREGKPIGTIFVLGNSRSLAKYARPLMLNPLKGHSRTVRSVHNPDFFETLRELASIDGAFVIDTRGVVVQAGVYLDAPLTSKVVVRKGLGSRHVAAAALSARTKAIAFVISESSGNITIFADGSAVLELEGRP